MSDSDLRDRAAFVGQDRYARFAFGRLHQVGSSLADANIHVAARGLSNTVIPDIDDGVFLVSGEATEEVKAIRDVLFGRSGHKLWTQPRLAMELQMYIGQLLEDGDVFVHLSFDRASDSEPYLLQRFSWLPPETMLHRARLGVYEQFVSRHALEGSGYHYVGEEPKDRLVEFPESEIFHLRWTLDEPAGPGSPADAARRLGKRMDRESERGLLAMRARTEATETYLPVARARAGAFSDALERQKRIAARIMDMLLYPGASEAESFPWVETITDYFAADRILLSRAAIARIRQYLLEEFNRQVIGRWQALNAWSSVQLELRPALFAPEDWVAMREQLAAGKLDLADVRAAVQLEWEIGHAFGRTPVS